MAHSSQRKTGMMAVASNASSRRARPMMKRKQRRKKTKRLIGWSKSLNLRYLHNLLLAWSLRVKIPSMANGLVTTNGMANGMIITRKGRPPPVLPTSEVAATHPAVGKRLSSESMDGGATNGKRRQIHGQTFNRAGPQGTKAARGIQRTRAGRRVGTLEEAGAFIERRAHVFEILLLLFSWLGLTTQVEPLRGW